LVDHFGIEGMIRAARTARRAGIPVVADFERVASPQFTILLELVDHLVVSREFAESLTGGLGPPEVLRALWNPGRATVVVTCGAEGAWYLTRDGEPVHQQAFRVDAVDTTGCGDVFHGAYAAALAREVGIAERIRFASAAGALKACSAGGQAGIPNKAAVDGFLKTRPAPRRHAK
jgi:ribokinase